MQRRIARKIIEQDLSVQGHRADWSERLCNRQTVKGQTSSLQEEQTDANVRAAENKLRRHFRYPGKNHSSQMGRRRER